MSDSKEGKEGRIDEKVIELENPDIPEDAEQKRPSFKEGYACWSEVDENADIEEPCPACQNQGYVRENCPICKGDGTL